MNQLIYPSAAMAAIILAKKTKGSSSKEGPAQWTGISCPITPASVVDWSIDRWWHPVPTTEIDWAEFREAVDLKAKDIGPNPYLPWLPDWEPWDDFYNRKQPQYHESFYKTLMPSGHVLYVWRSGGVENYWSATTINGMAWNPEEDGQLIDTLWERLDELEEQQDIALEDTLRQIQRLEI